MQSPTREVPRLLECGTAVDLCQRSPLAIRCYLTLFWGEDSERPGFGRCVPSLLADTLGSSKRAVVSALDELASAGLIVWSADERLAYRPGFANRFKPHDWRNRVNWWNAAARLRDGLIASQVREDIGGRPEVTSEVTSKVACQVTSEVASQDLSVSSVSSVNNISKRKAGRPRKEASQLALTPEEPPAMKPWQRAAEVAVLWNEIMRYQPQCKVDKTNLRVLAAAYDSHGIDGLRALMVWAQTDDWSSGKKGQPKLAQQWLSKAGLSIVEQKRKNAGGIAQQSLYPSLDDKLDAMGDR